MRRIKLHTSAGLANRLRSLDSAVILSRLFGARLDVYWPVNPQLGATFEDLFMPVSLFRCYKTNESPSRTQKLLRKAGQITGISCDLSAMNLKLGPFSITIDPEQRYQHRLRLGSVKPWTAEISITTDHAFCYPEDLSYLKPIPEIRERIRSFSTTLTQETIGIHIRRGDHDFAIRRSPLETFLREADSALRDAERANIFLATDDHDVKKRFLQQFRSRLVTLYACPSRGSVEGVRDAVVDLWCLAHCGRIWGSMGSSFSEMAFYIGGGDYSIIDGEDRREVLRRKKRGIEMD